MGLHLIALISAAAVFAAPRLWPRGVVVVSTETMFNHGTLTRYERVSGLKAIAAWRRGELEREQR